MNFGKIITEQPVHDGQMRAKKVWHREVLDIKDNTHLLNETLSCLDLAINNVSDDVELTIKRHKDGKLRLIKTYRVE